MVTVTALNRFTYKGRAIQAGDVLDVTPIEAASLKYRGRVKLGRQIGAMTTRDMRPESNAEESTETSKPKRRYQRRELTAEP